MAGSILGFGGDGRYEKEKMIRNTKKSYWMFCLMMASGFPLFAQHDQPRKNVLFFLVDDLRPNLGCYGDSRAHTPNIDRLAGRGVAFANAYCQQAICSPSRTSMLTGLRPHETGVYNLQTHFRELVPNAVTLPQSFKNDGYFTASTGKIFHNSKHTLDPVSWTKVISPRGGRTYVLPENQNRKGKQGITEAADVPDTAYTDGKIAMEAMHLLTEAREKDTPFFIAVGFLKPHAPFCAPKTYWDLYNRSAFGVTDRNRPVGSPDLAFHQWQELRGYRDVPDEGGLSPEQEQKMIHGYYACISYVDAQIGKVMDHLETLGLSDQTIVVLWGDHGYHLGEQDLWCKSTNFELDARVPLIIASPEMEGNGKMTKAIVESVDIYPTLSELCGMEQKHELAGTSLTPLLDDPLMSWEYPAFSQFVRPYQAAINQKSLPVYMGYSVRVAGWRCTYWYDIEGKNVVERELYRMDHSDPERENVAGRPAVAAIETRLADLIDQYRRNQYRKRNR